MSNAKIMIVEDEEYIVGLLKASLEEMGYTVVGYTNSGKKSVVLANQLHPDLVLMDIQIEGPMNGIETADIIQNHMNIPIIFLTAYDDDEKLKQATMARPFGYLLKPFRARELRVAIEMALYRKAIESADHNSIQYLEKICHTLRASMDTILSTCQSLGLDPQLTESQRNSVESIHKRGKDTLTLIDEALTRIEKKYYTQL